MGSISFPARLASRASFNNCVIRSDSVSTSRIRSLIRSLSSITVFVSFRFPGDALSDCGGTSIIWSSESQQEGGRDEPFECISELHSDRGELLCFLVGC